MKCRKCHTENPDGRKFCRECGAKLVLVCPKCGAENFPGDKFCGECGHNLRIPSEPIPKDLSFDEKIEKIQRYLPEGLTEKILSQRDKIEGEHKQVTVMFCDMEGFTTLVEKLGPEEAYSIMDQVYEILIHKVHDYEGTVNEMTGDGIMALFGAPIALEDALQRAIRSSLAIHREIARFSNTMRHEKKAIPPFKMRIGINTGPVVVGTLGNDLRVEFKAVGDTVNLASRMEELAEPGTSYVTEATFKLTEGLFRFEALGEKEVKGREEPVRIYRVIAPSTRRTKFDVSAERGLTPFVGRERELEILLDSFERAKAGRGQAISIMSEAGVGKSRLLYEFRKAVANEDATFLEGKCLSYSRGVAYHPVIDILKSNFDIQEADGDSEIREKVKEGLKILAVDESSTLPYLLELLSLKDSGIDQIPTSPEERKVRVTDALTRIVLRGSELRPLIMAFEDLHWSDKSSAEALKDLLDNIAVARVFLLFTYRPEFVHTWGARSYHSQVTLNRLSNRESLAMVSNLLGTEEIERDLEDLILEKTEGVPFFIEEFIKSLQNLKVIERKDNRYHLIKDIQKVTIPSTIQDVIMARIDSLPEGAKEVLQKGSVIEREFNYELIKQVTGLPEKELLSRLSALKDSELLYERGIYPHSSYIFKHALTQEVVYDSILTKRKKQLHEDIGNAIEKLYKDTIYEQYGIVAEHFIESENYEKGALYSKLAGKKAEKAASLNDAIEYATKRVACLESLPKTDDMDKRIIDARTALGLYYVQINYHVAAKEAVDPIINLATKHASKRRLSQIYSIVGSYNCWVEEDFPSAFKYLEDAVKISGEIHDAISLFFGCFWLAVALALSCEFEKAYQNFQKALDINVMAKTLWGISSMKSNISFWVYCLQGRINLAHQTSGESLQIANESGDILSKGMAYASYGTSCYFKGEFNEAENNLLKGLEFSEKTAQIGWASVAAYSLGETYSDMGEHKKAEQYYTKTISFLEQSRLLPSYINQIRVSIARSRALNNEQVSGLSDLFECYNENKLKTHEGWMARYIAEILLNIDDQHMPEAEDWINKAIEADKRNSMMFNLGKDYALYADMCNRKGDQSKAKENLNKAIEIYKECGADGWVKKAEEELAALS
jgi:class 3 adenylate cyclase/tetratricopeptide (TPR) repeat protein/ribosomal protein L40E